MTDDTPPLRTIERAFAILEVLREEKTMGVTELSDRLDLPKSTVHEYLRTLRTLGYIVNEGGRYRLGFRLLEFGGQLKYRNRSFHVARPELERLVERTGELASINVEERGRFVIVHAEYGDEALRLGIYPGMTIPIHSHAAGKVMLAHFPEEKVDRIVDEHGLSSVTEQSITDREELDDELAAIRDRGYAVDWNQQIVGMGVVAAPVQGDDDVIGSLGIVCPTDRLRDEEYRAELAREVQKSANIVSVNYQYSP